MSKTTAADTRVLDYTQNPFRLVYENAMTENQPGHVNIHPITYTMSSLLDLMSFDATENIDLINVPLLMIAGSEADTRYMTDQAFPRATGTDDKELFLIEGAKHIETYWVDDYVDAAVVKLSAFYARTIAS